MVKCTTKTGFTCELPDNALDNMELVDVMADSSMNPGFRASATLRLLLTPDQKKALYDHLRTEDGRVSIVAVNEAIVDIFNCFNQQGKNS